MRTNADTSWLEKVKRRLPMMRPGILVVSSEGVGVFMCNLAGSERIFGVKRGDRIVLETGPALCDD